MMVMLAWGCSSFSVIDAEEFRIGEDFIKNCLNLVQCGVNMNTAIVYNFQRACSYIDSLPSARSTL
jgi:hypothetical protein